MYEIIHSTVFVVSTFFFYQSIEKRRGIYGFISFAMYLWLTVVNHSTSYDSYLWIVSLALTFASLALAFIISFTNILYEAVKDKVDASKGKYF